MSPYCPARLQADLARIHLAYARLELSEFFQDVGPEEAALLLREAQEELDRLAAELSPAAS